MNTIQTVSLESFREEPMKQPCAGGPDDGAFSDLLPPFTEDVAGASRLNMENTRQQTKNEADHSAPSTTSWRTEQEQTGGQSREAVAEAIADAAGKARRSDSEGESPSSSDEKAAAPVRRGREKKNSGREKTAAASDPRHMNMALGLDPAPDSGTSSGRGTVSLPADERHNRNGQADNTVRLSARLTGRSLKRSIGRLGAASFPAPSDEVVADKFKAIVTAENGARSKGAKMGPAGSQGSDDHLSLRIANQKKAGAALSHGEDEATRSSLHPETENGTMVNRQAHAGPHDGQSVRTQAQNDFAGIKEAIVLMPDDWQETGGSQPLLSLKKEKSLKASNRANTVVGNLSNTDEGKTDARLIISRLPGTGRIVHLKPSMERSVTQAALPSAASSATSIRATKAGAGRLAEPSAEHAFVSHAVVGRGQDLKQEPEVVPGTPSRGNPLDRSRGLARQSDTRSTESMDVEKTVLQGQERKDEHSGSPIRTTVHLPTTLSLASRQMNRVALWASFQSGQEGLQNSLTHQVTEQLSSWLKSSSFQFVNGKIKTMTMTVYPEQLGQLSISITQNDDGLTAMLTAETKTAGHLLESGLNQLKHDLAGRGIPFVKIDIADQWQTAVPENQQSGDGQSSESFQQQNGRSNQQQQDKKKKIVSLLNNEDKTPAFPFQAWIEGGIRKG